MKSPLTQIAVLMSLTVAAAAAQLTVTFLPPSSATYPPGTSFTGFDGRTFTAQSTDPAGPFTNLPCIFRGYQSGGSTEHFGNIYLIYRIRLDFDEEVILNSFTEIGAGAQWSGAFWRLLDTNQVVLSSNVFAVAENCLVTNRLNVQLRGRAFIIDEFDVSITWRYREQFLVSYTPVDTQSFLTNGLVAYYPFEGNANDESGYSNNGIVTNAVLTQDRFGGASRAYSFGSIDCEITSPFQGVIGSNPRTVSCWIRQSDNLQTNWGEVINWAIGGQCASQFSCGFNADVNFGADRFYFGVSIDVGCGMIVYDAGQWDGRWHHYAWVVPDVQNPKLTDVKIFRDGSLLTAPLWHYRGEAYSSAVLLNSSPHDMTIPRGGALQGFGSIDDLRVYNRALSASEIQQLYQYESGGSGPKVALLKAVKPSFTGLSLGANYQLQTSTDMSTWTNSGSAFTATNTSIVYPQYWDVDNWNSLFFRLQVAP